MFEEIPSPQPAPSYRSAIATFAIMFTCFLSCGAIMWIRWTRPLSAIRKFEAAEMIVCGVLSGIFLVAAKAVPPEANRKRIAILFIVFMVFQVIIDVIR